MVYKRLTEADPRYGIILEKGNPNDLGKNTTQSKASEESPEMTLEETIHQIRQEDKIPPRETREDRAHREEAR